MIRTTTSKGIRRTAERLGFAVKRSELAASERDDFTVIDGTGRALVAVYVFVNPDSGKRFTDVYDVRDSRNFNGDLPHSATGFSERITGKKALYILTELGYAPALVSDVTLTDSGRAKLAGLGYDVAAINETPAPAVNLDPHLTALPAAPVASPVGWPTVAVAGTPELAAMIDAAPVEKAEAIVYVKAHYYVGNRGSYLSGVQILALFASELEATNGIATRKAISRRVFNSEVYSHLITITKFERM